jgi:hypothetical protein
MRSLARSSRLSKSLRRENFRTITAMPLPAWPPEYGGSSWWGNAPWPRPRRGAIL